MNFSPRIFCPRLSIRPETPSSHLNRLLPLLMSRNIFLQSRQVKSFQTWYHRGIPSFDLPATENEMRNKKKNCLAYTISFFCIVDYRQQQTVFRSLTKSIVSMYTNVFLILQKLTNGNLQQSIPFR
jgi:hypothetical protein